MRKEAAIISALTFSPLLQAEKFDVCRDIVIDQVTEMAFGQQGVPYTGEVVCFRDEENTILKLRRVFDNGKPIGRHVCYTNDGIPNYSVSYDQTNVRKHSYNYKKLAEKYGSTFGSGDCVTEGAEPCWRDFPCKENEKRCNFRCN